MSENIVTIDNEMNSDLFLKELNKLYNEFTTIIFKDYEQNWSNELFATIAKRTDLYEKLDEICHFILYNFEFVSQLPKEDLYMVFNCIKLSKHENRSIGWALSMIEEYQNLCQNYTNSR